jgi:ribosomal protein L37AE/L43A
MTDGGDGVFVLDDEAEQRRRASLRAAESNTRFKKGVPSKNKGIPMSEETKEKCRQAQLGNKYALGTKHTEQTRANMSAAHKGKPSNMLGKKHSPETIEKMRLSKLGKPSGKEGYRYSPEQLERIAQKLRANPWTCPHCQKTGYGVGAKNRWHFDNCKIKGESS